MSNVAYAASDPDRPRSFPTIVWPQMQGTGTGIGLSEADVRRMIDEKLNRRGTVRMEITAEMAKGLWDHLSDEFDSMVLDKGDSDLMEVIGWFLDAIGVLDKERFLADYGTTLIDRIYIPFTPGEVSVKWTPVKQVSMAIHEHQHVFDCEEVGAWKFSTGYLASKATRAEYEALAYRTNLEFYWWLAGNMGSASYYAEKIRSYGCGDDQVAFIRAFLESSIHPIREGEIISPVCQVAFAWLEKNRR